MEKQKEKVLFFLGNLKYFKNEDNPKNNVCKLTITLHGGKIKIPTVTFLDSDTLSFILHKFKYAIFSAGQKEKAKEIRESLFIDYSCPQLSEIEQIIK